LLDLFSGAGGAARGYQLAGFHVTGVDINPQPHYIGDEFHQDDAMTFPLDGFDVIHASPPCQAYSSLASLHDKAYPDLYGAIRARFIETGRPWVIENVIGAPYRSGIVLCGSMFDAPLNRTRRHRNFESGHLMMAPPCRHREQPALIGIYGASDGAHEPGFKHIGAKRGPRQATTTEAREIMGMPWAVQRRELTQAIPPAYTEWIGLRFIEAMEAAA